MKKILFFLAAGLFISSVGVAGRDCAKQVSSSKLTTARLLRLVLLTAVTIKTGKEIRELYSRQEHAETIRTVYSFGRFQATTAARNTYVGIPNVAADLVNRRGRFITKLTELDLESRKRAVTEFFLQAIAVSPTHLVLDKDFDRILHTLPPAEQIEVIEILSKKSPEGFWDMRLETAKRKKEAAQ